MEANNMRMSSVKVGSFFIIVLFIVTGIPSTLHAKQSEKIGTINILWKSNTISAIQISTQLIPKMVLFNNPPGTPSEPSGPSAGEVGKNYTYCTNTTDPDGNNIRYYWMTDGLGQWTDHYYGSGYNCYKNITFSKPGTYYIKVKAQDIYGATSEYSPAKKVVIGSSGNYPPLEPDKPNGFSSGYTNVSYMYSAVTTDSNHDNITYGWDWTNDFVVDEWSEFKNSGSPDNRSHEWKIAGTYKVRVVAMDIYDACSLWSSPLEVTIKSGIPDLESEYSLGWSSVKPGSTVNGSFNVKNVGNPSSKLNWRIESYPEWGDWTIIPSNGNDLKPEDGTVSVKVTVIVPIEENSKFTGNVKVVNQANNDDYELIVVSLTTPKIRPNILSYGYNFLEKYPQLFPYLRERIGEILL